MGFIKQSGKRVDWFASNSCYTRSLTTWNDTTESVTLLRP